MEQGHSAASPTPIESWPAPVNEPSTTVQARTAEPRRPATIVAAALVSLAGMVFAIAGLLASYWTAIREFSHASPLFSWFNNPNVGIEVVLAVALTLIVLLIVAIIGITGYYAWWGYGWTRTSGIIATVGSLLLLIAHPLGWAAIVAAIVSAVLIWLPPSRTYFAAWQDRRHPAPSFIPSTGAVKYGPLRRYRRN